MPYLVLAIGLSMSAFGLSAVWFGYPIIQVERGWASVIAGATMLTGGLMTIALGLMFRALVSLKSALLRAAASTQGAVDRDFGDIPILTPALVPVAPTLDGVLAADTPNDPVPIHSFETDTNPTLDHERLLASLLEPEDHRRTGIDEHALYAAAIDDDPPPDHAEPSVAGHEPPALATKDSKPSSDGVGAPPTAHDPTSLDPQPAPPPTGDWLDRAFSDLDHELGTPHGGDSTPHPPEPSLAPPVVSPVHTTPVAEPEPARDSRADVAVAERPVAESGDVIGRYEADGTFYTMYADGSIEAQSEAGVYRFASMAELRTFIEG